MAGEFLGKISPATDGWIHGVVDGNLAVLMVKPRINVLSTFFEDFLPENHGWRRCVWEEIILRDVAMIANGRSSVVTEMEDAGLDTEPESAKNASVVNNRGPSQSPIA